MARIFYSMAGEGRGHATRVRCMVEALRDEHELVLYAPGNAHSLLAPLYEGTEVEVRSIPGLRFRYNRWNHLSASLTAWSAALYLWDLNSLIDRLRRDIENECPDLVVTDFEPALARAACRAKVPFISLNHQHFLVVNDLTSLPWWLQFRASQMAQVVKCYYRGQRETVVSSFFRAPMRKGLQQVSQIGALLRPEIMKAEGREGDYLLVYLRRNVPDNVMTAFEECGREVRVYGLGEHPARGNLTFKPIDNHRFVEDLAGCDALISTAGNQLVGEALYLGKPVMALPEVNNFEQYINAHFLKASGAGDWAEMKRFRVDDLRRFLHRTNYYRLNIEPEKICGNAEAVAAVERNLPKGRTEPKPVFSARRRRELVAS